MSGDSNNVSQDPFAGLLDEDMEEEPVTVNNPPPPTASSEPQRSDPPLPSTPPPETPIANPIELDRVAGQVEPTVDPVVADRG